MDALWRMFRPPVQSSQAVTTNVFLKAATFLCHLHRKMPDLVARKSPGAPAEIEKMKA
jgi:hypothetical protein